MMRWGARLALLLLILNLVVLGTGWALERYRQGERYLPGYNVDKIHLLRAPGEAGPARDGGPGALGVDSGLAGIGEQPEAPSDAAAKPAAGTDACLVLPAFDQAAHERLRAELAGTGLKPGDYNLQLAKPLGWWVYIPPEANAALRQETMARLRALGITDLAVIGRGSMLNAISLGMFAEPGQASAHLERLQARGVPGAVYGPRPDAGPARLDLSALSADRRAGLQAELRQRLRACP